MLVYEGIKNEFLESVVNDTIAFQIEKNILKKLNRYTSKSEFISWENSMQYMYKVLNDKEIPENSGICIEYNIPQTSKRVDFIISGLSENNINKAIVIELKQWDTIKIVEGKDALVETFIGKGIRTVVHPSYQVWSYVALIKDYNENVQEKNIELHPCAYLHNYRKTEKDPVEDRIYYDYIKEAPVFARGEVEKLRSFIKKSIKYGDNKDTLLLIDNSKIRPSKMLQNSLRSMLKGNKEFVMIDEQKIIFEEILYISKLSKSDSKKRVYIAKGGPGTGKSVIAVNLLAELTSSGQFCQYVSKNSAPRYVYSAMLKGFFKKTNIDNLFKGSGSYLETNNNVVDTLIVDEAHRLNEKSGMFNNLGENQIMEIIKSSKCSIFFIDEHQRIHINDNGNIEGIKKWAQKYNADIFENELVSQFRCNGSDGYLAWIDNVLQINETANKTLTEIDYDFKIFDDPHSLKKIIVERNKINNRSRILVGYCWDWIKEGKNKTSVKDIKINDFEMSWNLGNTSTYAIDKNSVEEAGCIHTSQGLEFDYVGVIIGNDLRYENGEIVTDFTKRAKTDQSLKGIKSLFKKNPDKALKIADEIIKNTYRTLLTRGMKGCYVFCVDEGLREYLKEKAGRKNG
jgi:DUF2075 family protein